MPSRQLSEWMETRGINLSYSDYAVRLDLLARTKGIAVAEKYFDGLSQFAKNQLTYGALFNCYCREKMSEKAMELLEKMRELNFASTSLVYNNLASLYIRLGQPEKVPALVEEMKANNIIPDTFTYNVLMNCYASLKDYEAVERVMDEIKAAGKVSCDWTTYSNLAAIYVAGGLFERADLALKELEKTIDIRDRRAFHFLISLYAGTSNLAEVKRVWKSLKSSFQKTTNLSYLVMLQALSKLDDFDGLKECFEEWESCYSSYDIRLTNVLINAYIRRDMIREAEVLSESTVSKGSGPNFRTLEMFMDYYLKNHQMDLAFKTMDIAVSKVKDNEWQPNKEKVRAFLKYFEEENDVDGAEEFCRKLKKVIPLDSEVYDFLLRTYIIGAGKSEPLMRQRMKEDGIEMSSESEKLLEKVCPQ
ncbi:tetratricopeptide repeat (TPR)-like superfamily protein isoform X2 [Tasmannia lanceolata]|uniref:tetratricopeptide repeat (TPR)-like superfamily protein isoform X2 n=1 Tax=Tasmannia lanceolata TaxID=3420 RepID=UPI00406450A6